MPPLPADAAAARAAGTETALAYAIEQLRLAVLRGATPPPALQDLFTRSLADLVADALSPGAGDPAFQALVLKAQDADVDEHVRLATLHVVDRRAVRTALDAVAHPGKLRALPPGALHEGLSRLHALAVDGAWLRLQEALVALLETASLAEPVRLVLENVLHQGALQRLARAQALLEREAVQRYLALCERRGPAAGTQAAAAQGRAAARTGGDAEASVMLAFRELAALLRQHAPAGTSYRAVASLRTPRGFPGEADKAKDEWDAAILRDDDGAAGSAIELLAEVKAAPAAATPDLARLLRGLRRLAGADPHAPYLFPSAGGELRLRGDALQALQPDGQRLPLQVIYCSLAAPEAQVQMLSAASKAVLLAEPASIAYAHALLRGEAPRHEDLQPVWAALPASPQLRSALHQYDTARAVREAMLHPQDLLEAARALA